MKPSIPFGFIFVCLIGSIALPGYALSRENTRRMSKVIAQARSGFKGRYAPYSADLTINWCSTLQKAYGWERGNWVLDDTYRRQYDSRGLMTEEEVTDAEGYITRTVNTWNEYGQLAARLTEVASHAGSAFRNSSRLSRQYDERLLTFITVNDQEVWVENDWRPSNSYRQTVTRDEAGNVVQMERAVYFGGIFDPVYRINVAYGEDGKASGIEVSELVNDYLNNSFKWNVAETYRDLVWDTTDGQIVSVDNLFSGANRLASATVIDEDGVPMNVEAIYDPDGSYRLTMSMTDDGVAITGGYDFTPLDPYGSVKINSVATYALPDGTTESDYSAETYRYDPYGLILLEEAVEWSDYTDEEEVVFRTVGEVEYDPDKGYPLVWTVQEYDTEAMELYNAFRAEYYDYIDPTAGMTGPQTESPARWYTMQGLPIDSPSAPGVYIHLSGGKSEKVLITSRQEPRNSSRR